MKKDETSLNLITRWEPTNLHLIAAAHMWMTSDGYRPCSKLLRGIDTRTGRLSSRKPNLHQVPAVNKDYYQARRYLVRSECCWVIYLIEHLNHSGHTLSKNL